MASAGYMEDDIDDEEQGEVQSAIDKAMQVSEYVFTSQIMINRAVIVTV